MKPDDFMERGYLLPEGCKDLTDAWKVKSRGPSNHLSAFEQRDSIRRLIDYYTKKLADPNLTGSQRATIESNLKELRKLTGDRG